MMEPEGRPSTITQLLYSHNYLIFAGLDHPGLHLVDVFQSLEVFQMLLVSAAPQLQAFRHNLAKPDRELQELESPSQL